MNFFDRLRFARGLVFGDVKQVATMIATWESRVPLYPRINFENMVRLGYRKNELIFSCISKTANTASSVTLRVYDARTEEEIPDHPLRRLIEKPNPFMAEFEFWSAILIYQKLAGRAYFEKVRSRAGRVVQLWPLRPDWVRIIRSPTKLIGGYLYAIPGLDPIPLAPEDVLDFKLFDPLDQYGSQSPAEVAARVGDVDNKTTDFLKIFFEKGGVPPGLLKTKTRLQDAQVADIQRRWSMRYGGAEKWAVPAVLDSEAEYQKTGLDFREMGFDVIDARNEARICMVMGVPPIMVGAKVGLDRSTFSNYREARTAWWEDDLMPQYKHLRDGIKEDLQPAFGGNIFVRWDFSKVSALQEEIEKRWKRAGAALVAGWVTVNEARKEVGVKGIGPTGDVFLRALNTIEVPTARVRQTVEAVGQSPQTTEEASRIMVKYLTAALSPNGDESKAAENAPDDDDRRERERVLTQAVEDFFAGEENRVGREALEQFPERRG